ALGTTRFDETFQGWGAEDCDFCFALQRSGSRFFSLREPLAVHMVHRTTGAETKQREHVENQLRLHRKAPCLESELFVALGSIRNHLFAERMEAFDRALINGRIPLAELSWAAARLGPGPRLGVHFLASEAAQLGCDVAASCFERGHGARGPTFLVDAQFPGWHARTAILSDTFWILPAEIRGLAMQSVRALAEKVVTLHLAPDSGPDAGFRGRVRSALGWDTLTETLLFERARELDLASEVSGRQGGVAIVEHTG
ncbi:MAG TPA: hypothetical protein VHP33_39400, partial [Polyangiaceae bacterium]|nr:hypothetical protein [Polyangiaceae bacterium]